MAYGPYPTALKSQIEGDAGSAHWSMDTSVTTDDSGNGFTFSTSGTPTIDNNTTISNFGDRPHALLNSTDQLTQSSLTFSTGSWSLSFWYYFDTVSSTNFEIMFDLGYVGIKNYFSDIRLSYYDGNFDGDDKYYDLSSEPATATWNHFVLVHNDTTSTMDVYLNGTNVLAKTSFNPDYDNTIFDFFPYGPDDSAVQEISYFDGYTLDSSEVSSLYNSGDGVGWNYVATLDEEYTGSGGLTIGGSANYAAFNYEASSNEECIKSTKNSYICVKNGNRCGTPKVAINGAILPSITVCNMNLVSTTRTS